LGAVRPGRVEVNRTIFVMAQDPDGAWGTVPRYRHCLPVGDEPLIARTCRLVGDCDVVAPRDMLASHALTGLSLPDPGLGLLNGVVQVMDLARSADEIVILLGDVLYSPRAIAWLVEDDAPVRFVGRFLPNAVSGKVKAEMYGFRASGPALADIYRVMKRVTRSDYHKGHGLWALWDNLVCPPTVDLNDYTDDVDSPEEFAIYWPRMLRAALG
jgi:hypothetical protein